MAVFEDVRLALRLLRRAPAPTGIALLSIALSVSAPAVVFTAVKAVLIDPLPYARAGELVQLRTDFANAPPSHGDWVFWHDAQEVVRRTHTLASAGFYGNAVFDLAGDATTAPEALYGLRVSASLFPTLGVSPLLGRNILANEDQPHHANEMILSYGLWTRRFHADRDVIGRSVTVNGRSCLILGVMPPDFNFPLRRDAVHTPNPYVEFWAPLGIDPAATQGALGAVARLRPGIPLIQAQQEAAAIGAALAHEFPATNRDHTLRLGLLRDRTVRGARNALWLLLAASVMFLLIGCANVANLLLVRGLARRHEIAVRVAIGAGSARIVRQLLTESGVLALLGGLAGYALTAMAWKILPSVAPASIPRLGAARADWSILGFALAVALLNGILFGLAPALRAVGTGTSAPRDRTRAFLVGSEVAIAVTLVVLGGQLLGSFIRLLQTDPGFEPGRILASVVLPARERYDTPEKKALLYHRFLNAVRALPGVERAGTVDALPFSGENHGGFITATEAGALDPASQTLAEIDVAGGDYLETMGLRLLQGRWFREEEMQPLSRTAIVNVSGTAIVNHVVAARLWPGSNAVGQRICVFCTPENPDNWKRVVGVVSGLRHSSLDGPEPANVYLAAGALSEAAFLVVRTNGHGADLEQSIRRAISAIDPHQPVLLSASLQTLIADSMADRRFILTLLAATGCLALLLAAAGVYGVTSYTTSRRTQEIAIRMALGATQGNVQALLFRQGFFSVITGLLLGLALTFTVLQLLRGALPGLEANRPAYFWSAALLVSLAGALACWVPARGAATLDPMRALREEGGC